MLNQEHLGCGRMLGCSCTNQDQNMVAQTRSTTDETNQDHLATRLPVYAASVGRKNDVVTVGNGSMQALPELQLLAIACAGGRYINCRSAGVSPLHW